ncbi:coiled-coil domain-containing protein 149-like isoform X1 [Limulus polyphemus]|uniref:Coiled-coil domain-containing protein 149-like isoform X1 n=1 Tax=Limulus polyphemus TaxID=6850 RepID=A0ABM1TKH4_LIMPO|nr:coiled-coil domain-containing protein 149-like isoform X1 [Limulus polyphemus]
MAKIGHQLQLECQNLRSELNITKCKLESKNEAVLILNRELDQYRSERDQLKLMADQLRERYNSLKKRVEGWGPSLMGVYDIRGFRGEGEQSLAQLLCELKEKNRALQTEVDDLKQKLSDAQGDTRLLRHQLARQRSDSLDESFDHQFTPVEKEDLVKQMEDLQYKCSQLERDLQAVLDEKEELVTVRDAYHHKVNRLNQQLNLAIHGKEHRIVDIDAVLMENRYLQERVKQLQEEKLMLLSSLSKYKNTLDKKRSRTGLKFGSGNGGVLISSKQVQQLLQSNPFLDLPNNPSTLADLRTLVMALFESLNDKTLALSHQRKANKLLGNRITELEKQMQAVGTDSVQIYVDNEKETENFMRVYNGDGDGDIVDKMGDESLEATCVEQESSTHTESCCKSISDSDLPISNLEGQNNTVHHDIDVLPTMESEQSVGECSKSNSVISGCSSKRCSYPTTPLSTPVHVCSESQVPVGPLTQPRTRERQSESYEDEEKDDLPPQLQKLLVAALAELEDRSTTASPSSDPSC